VVASELPHPEGTAAGRDLWAWCEGIRALGHDLDAWLWRLPASSPDAAPPAWCRYEPVDVGPLWRAHLRGISRPRHDSALGAWEPEPGSVAVADHLWSFAAVARHPRSVATFHYRSRPDALASRDFRLAHLQSLRAERYAGRAASLVLSYSPRVARGLKKTARFVPIAYPVPSAPVPPAEAPVAAMIADWSWPPNRRALSWLLEAWPDVRRAVPSATLLLAGRNSESLRLGQDRTVNCIGPVESSVEVLSRAAVVAFPCPASSGPKVKVLEALAHGIPVVTTPPGIEGIAVAPGRGVVVADRGGFADALAGLLSDPERRASLGASGRAAVSLGHSPHAAAAARLAAFEDAFAHTKESAR
jgi:glycosyltransferase involved in cell wall biosynthesis